MRKLFKPKTLYAACLCVSVSCLSSTALAAELILTVTDIKKTQGNMRVAVYADQESYDADKTATATAEHPVDASTETLTIALPNDATYAVKLYVDANENGKLDMNFMGIPKEPYGFSGSGGRFGPPEFSEASIEISGSTELTIQAR